MICTYDHVLRYKAKAGMCPSMVIYISLFQASAATKGFLQPNLKQCFRLARHSLTQNNPARLTLHGVSLPTQQ